MSPEKLIFPVQWRKIWWTLTVYSSVAVWAAILVAFLVRGIKMDFDYQRVFEHMSPIGIVGIALLASLVLGISMLFIALICSSGTIRIENDEIYGRNYWGLRQRIQLSELKKMYPFSSNGINCMVVESQAKKKIYILYQTENFQSLVQLLRTYLPVSEDTRHNK